MLRAQLQLCPEGSGSALDFHWPSAVAMNQCGPWGGRSLTPLEQAITRLVLWDSLAHQTFLSLTWEPAGRISGLWPWVQVGEGALGVTAEPRSPAERLCQRGERQRLERC